MPAPNKANPQCPDCGKLTRHKRTNQDGREIYDCTCGWSNSVKRTPKPLLKRRELNAIALRAAIELYQQPTYKGSFVDVSKSVGSDEPWLYSCDVLVNDLKRLLEERQ